VLTLYASHDDALAALREHAAGADPAHCGCTWTSASAGSVDAIRALNEGRCVMAGFHTLQHPAPGSLAERTYKPLLQPGLHKIIGFARRTQGLMVARATRWAAHLAGRGARRTLCQPAAGHGHPRAAGRTAGTCAGLHEAMHHRLRAHRAFARRGGAGGGLRRSRRGPGH
jgi:hypothetical protein